VLAFHLHGQKLTIPEISFTTQQLIQKISKELTRQAPEIVHFLSQRASNLINASAYLIGVHAEVIGV
jgi:hypothetical protein